MNIDQFLDHLTGIVHGDSHSKAEWWHLAALRCWERRHVQLIPARDGKSLYLPRFWLTPPKLKSKDTPDDGSPFESGNSVLLHCFVRGDDDGSLHDHPWEWFHTDILSGGYTERRPSPCWIAANQPHADRLSTILGQPFEHHQRLVRRPGGPREHRLGVDQHAVEDVLPDTWTVVTTGPRRRGWGFHPPGRPWIPQRDFLHAKRSASEATESLPVSG